MEPIKFIRQLSTFIVILLLCTNYVVAQNNDVCVHLWSQDEESNYECGDGFGHVSSCDNDCNLVSITLNRSYNYQTVWNEFTTTARNSQGQTGGNADIEASLLIRQGGSTVLHRIYTSDNYLSKEDLSFMLPAGDYTITLSAKWSGNAYKNAHFQIPVSRYYPQNTLLYDHNNDGDYTDLDDRAYAEYYPLYDTYTTMQVQLNAPPLTNLDEYRVVLYNYDNVNNQIVLALDGIKDPRKVTFPSKAKFEGYNHICDQYRNPQNAGQCIKLENAKYKQSDNPNKQHFDYVCGLGNSTIDWTYVVDDVDNDNKEDFQFYFEQDNRIIALSQLYPPGFIPIMYTNTVTKNWAYNGSTNGPCEVINVPFEGLTFMKTNPESELACSSEIQFIQEAGGVTRYNVVACSNCKSGIKVEWQGADIGVGGEASVTAGNSAIPVQTPAEINTGVNASASTGWKITYTDNNTSGCFLNKFSYPYNPDLINRKGTIENAVQSTSMNRFSDRLFRIYPNPVADVGQMEFNLPSEQEVTVELYDLYGKHIKTLLMQETLPSGQFKLSIPTGDIPTGSYIMQLQTSEGLEDHHRLFKQ